MAPDRIAERLGKSIEKLDWTTGWIEDDDIIADIRGVANDLAEVKLAIERAAICPAVAA